MQFNKLRIRFGLKSIMLFTLIVAVALGLATAKLRRQKEQRAALGEMLGQGVLFWFTKGYELQTEPINYKESRYAIDDKGWSYNLFTPDLLQTIEFFDAHYGWPDEDPRMATWVSEMTNLKEFDAMRWQTLSALSQLTQLNSLKMGEESFGLPSLIGTTRDIESAEQRMAQLKSNPPAPIDLTPLKGLIQLKHLCLGGCGKTDLSSLAGMTELETLQLPFSGDADLSPLSQMKDLRSLELIGSPADDLTPLGGLTKLTSLDLTESNATDIRALAKLVNLATLKASGTQICDLSPLAGLRQLEHLTLADTQVTDLSPLREKMMLKRLYLSNTKVEDVSALADCSALNVLDLRYTQVSDISPLAHCKSLEELDIRGCPVTDLGPLRGCKFTIIMTLTQKVDIPQDLRRHIWRMDDS